MSFIILVFNLFLLVLTLFIIYKIILLAVREGINQSIIGKYIRKKNGNQNNMEAFYNKNSDDEI